MKCIRLPSLSLQSEKECFSIEVFSVDEPASTQKPSRDDQELHHPWIAKHRSDMTDYVQLLKFSDSAAALRQVDCRLK